MSAFWPLAESSWGPQERAAVLEVLESGSVTMGGRVREFEMILARFHGVKRAILVNSGSSANLISIAALAARERLRGLRGFARGDEAIVPAIAWPTTYSPLAQHGLRLRPVDVCRETLGMDLEYARQALTRSTRIIVGASILGFPAALDEMKGFARQHGLMFFEDNCESFGARLNGRPCGSFGDISTTSFFFSHHLSTIEGGAILTDDEYLADICVCLRAHGWARDLPVDSQLRPKTESAFGKAYQFLMPGYNVRPTEITAAIGLVQFSRLAELNFWRESNWSNFQSRFKGDPRWEIQSSSPVAQPIPFGFVITLPSPQRRSLVLAELDRAKIEYRMVTGGCFTEHEAARWYDYHDPVPPRLFHATRVHRCGFFVGNHARDLSRQINTLYDILGGIL